MQDNIGPDEDGFNFPEPLLDQISECSPEGFLLFIINENGEIEVFSSKNTLDVVEAGLRSKALKILNSLNAIEDNEIGSQLFQQKYGIQPSEEEEGEDEGSF